MTRSLLALAALVVLAGANVAPIGCPCSRQLEPTCGSDGITYPNACMLRCASRAGTSTRGADLRIAHEGACYKSAGGADPGCMCSRQMDKVCGTDGVTYANECKLRCAAARGTSSRGSDLSIAHQGACEQRMSSELTVEAAKRALPAHLLCMCRQVWKPVCGSDGVTYTNICALRCHAGRKASSAGLRVEHEGAC